MQSNPTAVIRDVLHAAEVKSPGGTLNEIAESVMAAFKVVGLHVWTKEDFVAELRSHLVSSKAVTREDLRYSVEILTPDDAPEEVLARVGKLDLARATFAAAVRQWPGRYIYLRQGAAVLARSDRMDNGTA